MNTWIFFLPLVHLIFPGIQRNMHNPLYRTSSCDHSASKILHGQENPKSSQTLPSDSMHTHQFLQSQMILLFSNSERLRSIVDRPVPAWPRSINAALNGNGKRNLPGWYDSKYWRNQVNLHKKSNIYFCSYSRKKTILKTFTVQSELRDFAQEISVNILVRGPIYTWQPKTLQTLPDFHPRPILTWKKKSLCIITNKLRYS